MDIHRSPTNAESIVDSILNRPDEWTFASDCMSHPSGISLNMSSLFLFVLLGNASRASLPVDLGFCDRLRVWLAFDKWRRRYVAMQLLPEKEVDPEEADIERVCDRCKEPYVSKWPHGMNLCEGCDEVEYTEAIYQRRKELGIEGRD